MINNLLQCKEKGVEKIWLQSYPPGVPAEIDPDAYQSIVDVFEKVVRNMKMLPLFIIWV